MKKFIALAIAIMMLAALAVPAFAAETFTNVDPAKTVCSASHDASQTTAETYVEYCLDETYTLTIPAEVVLTAVGGDLADGLEGTAALVVEDTYIGYGRELTVSATAEFVLQDKDYDTVGGNAVIDYTMTSDNTSETLDKTNDTAEVLVVAAGTTNETATTTTLSFEVAAGDVVYAGCYNDTITFTAAVAAQ